MLSRWLERFFIGLIAFWYCYIAFQIARYYHFNGGF